jgi:hypothetical protein
MFISFLPHDCISRGSPLFWIGVGVGLSALFSWVRTRSLLPVLNSVLQTSINVVCSAALFNHLNKMTGCCIFEGECFSPIRYGCALFFFFF